MEGTFSLIIEYTISYYNNFFSLKEWDARGVVSEKLVKQAKKGTEVKLIKTRSLRTTTII